MKGTTHVLVLAALFVSISVPYTAIIEPPRPLEVVVDDSKYILDATLIDVRLIRTEEYDGWSVQYYEGFLSIHEVVVGSPSLPTELKLEWTIDSSIVCPKSFDYSRFQDRRAMWLLEEWRGQLIASEWGRIWVWDESKKGNFSHTFVKALELLESADEKSDNVDEVIRYLRD